jgi:hypothetical protein
MGVILCNGRFFAANLYQAHASIDAFDVLQYRTTSHNFPKLKSEGD